MAVMSWDREPERLFANDADKAEASTRWQMRQSWAIAMNRLQQMLAEQGGTVSWSSHVEDSSAPRVRRQSALVTPGQLKDLIPMSQQAANTILRGRREAEDIVHFRDDRLLVLVGPCSIHDPVAALEYADRLKKVADRLTGDLCIVLRAYFEKPRTTTGWKGLISDPDLDDSSNINKGLHVARQLCSDMTDRGLPIAGELLDPVTPMYYSDFLSVGAIGARTTESQPHREFASSLPFPIGFKNGTEGSVTVAVNGLTSAAGAHTFGSLTDNGTTAIVESSGNPDCFIILRGGSKGPNFSAEHVDAAHQTLVKSGHTKVGIMVDCSHGNSDKDYRKQTVVAESIGEQLRSGQKAIVGVMLESNLKPGKQALTSNGPVDLEKGMSITDGCIGWDSTVEVLDSLADAVRARRALRSGV